MNKTPYEIRLELLQMAKEHLDTTFKAQVDFVTQMLILGQQHSKITIEEMHEIAQKFMPTAYGFDEITKKAEELYSFVLKKKE